jgi:uncharacterized protein YqgV (UPF0045/DUF77 family)
MKHPYRNWKPVVSVLADTTNKLAMQMQAMNTNFNTRFDNLAQAVDKLSNSPSRCLQKHHKDHHGALDITLH